MTNAERYLKNGIDLQELCCNYAKFCNDRKIRLKEEEELERLNDGGKLGIFLQQNIKPTLTEDERVILRNIDTSKYNKIGVYDDTLMLFSSDELHEELYFFKQGLFQFIKERRRI